MKKYRVVVVGMGKRGKHHATAFQANPAFEVVGLCDIDEKRLKESAAQLGTNPATSTDAAALTASLKPDVFCFCTMPHLREPFIRIAIENRCRMVTFEKPLANSSANGLIVKKLVEDSGIKAVVSHQHRYGSHYRKVKEIIDSGALGRLHTVYATTPGWMLHMMTHMLDYMRWYNHDADASWVMAQAAGKRKFADNHPSPDYIAGVIQYANGVRGYVETGAGAPDQPEVSKWWGKNRIGAQGTEGFAEVLTNGGWRAVTRDGVASGGGAMNYDIDMAPYIQDMANWLNDDAKVHPCGFVNAYKGFEVMCGLCRSVVEGGQVALPLTGGMDELGALQAALSDKPVLLGSPLHAAEFGL